MHALIACHECDKVHRIQPLPKGGVAKCIRCGAVLYRDKPNSLDRTLALTLAALILFITANIYPFLALELEGREQVTLLFTGVHDLYEYGMWELSFLVLLTSIVIPLIHILGMLYVLLPLKFNRIPWKLALIFRIVRGLQPWGMMEVYMLGVLVSLVKLSDIATIVPGIALYSFALLILLIAGSLASLDPRIVWNRLKIVIP
jgi:paraquat-inducible protein A